MFLVGGRMIYAIDPTMYPRLIARAVQARDRDSLDWYRRQASDQIDAAKDVANALRWRAVMLAAVKGLIQVREEEVRA
jgi:hypothetical protein